MNPRTRVVSAALAALLTAAAVTSPRMAEACMPGASHPTQDAVIFWNDGVEVLVWRTSLEPVNMAMEAVRERRPDAGAPRAAAEAGRARPAAWVLAVPSAPIAYEVAPVADFDQAFGWFSAQRTIDYSPLMEGARTGGAPGGRGGLEIGRTVNVGEYSITPIRGRGPAAGRALTAWLASHRFPALNPAAVQAYVTSNATFLAVRANVPAGAARATLRPLAIAFRSERAVLPVRLSAGEAAFNLNAALVSSRAPVTSEPLSQGMVFQPVHAIAMPGATGPSGRAAIVPSVYLPASVRHLVEPLAGRVPQVGALLEHPVALSWLGADALTVNAAQPDPSVGFGAPIAANATAAVLDPIATATPTRAPAPAPVPRAPAPAPAPARR